MAYSKWIDEIMNTNENPFSDYGNIVEGARFIGRSGCLATIGNRVLRPKDPGNLAIIGEPRIGKSSLVHQAVIGRKQEYIEKGIVPIWVNLALFVQSSFFFRALVEYSFDELDDLNLLSDPIVTAMEKACGKDLLWSESYGRIQRYFKRIREAGHRILFILDEFDHARTLFKDDITGFQGLRELSYRPEWRVTYITTSRRTIREIEEQTQAISTFDGIFQKHYLGMFVSDDILEYYDRFSALGIQLESADRELIKFYCGEFPYLLEMIGYEIVEDSRNLGKPDIEKCAKLIESSLFDQYDRMINLLQEDQRLEKLLQILVGPTIDVKHTDVDNFNRYGLIQPVEGKDCYTAYSEHFHDYLKLVGRGIALWPLWQQTESKMRQVITLTLSKIYGVQWLEELEKSKPNIKKILENCRRAQKKEAKSFGNRASNNLIDFTYPSDLFQIIFAEWSKGFSDIFGKDKSYWSQRSDLLSKIRNPLAHSRDSVITEHERQIAEGFCKEIISLLEDF